MTLRFLALTAKLCAFTAVLTASAYAVPILYTVSGTFSDGGTVTGSFVYDATTNRYSNVNVVTTAGSVRGGATYHFVCGQDVPTCTGVSPDPTGYLNLTTTAANQTGMPAMSIFFPAPLPAGGGALMNVFALEANCSNAACAGPAGPSRSTATATATNAASFLSKIFPNLAAGDSIINIGNTGASAVTPTSSVAIGGNICVNVYVFSPDEQEVACCTCFITPNGVVTTSARQLISKTLTPAVPTAVTVKMIATDGSGGAASCNAASIGTLVPGLIAFGTNIHAATVGGSNAAGTYAVTETPFIPGTLSTAELSRNTTLCGFIQSNGTGFGVCPGCTVGAAGSQRQ